MRVCPGVAPVVGYPHHEGLYSTKKDRRLDGLLCNHESHERVRGIAAQRSLIIQGTGHVGKVVLRIREVGMRSIAVPQPVYIGPKQAITPCSHAFLPNT